MFQNFELATFLLALLPVLLAITVHEAAHGYAAKYYGDNMAQMLGRLTLNPIKHVDPVGTIVVPLITFLFTPFVFGWAKPVPINTRNFKNMRIGMRMVAIAGPLSNLVMALIWAVIMGLANSVMYEYQEPLFRMAQYGILINAVLFTLNMLPILPLDGGRFIDTFLPAKQSMQFQKIEPYGTWIILALLISGLLGQIMLPVVRLIGSFALMISQAMM